MDFLEELGIKAVNSGAWAGGELATPAGAEVCASVNPTTGEIC